MRLIYRESGARTVRRESRGKGKIFQAVSRGVRRRPLGPGRDRSRRRKEVGPVGRATIQNGFSQALYHFDAQHFASPELAEKTKRYLTKDEVKVVMARRDEIVAQFQELISEKGENEVLLDHALLVPLPWRIPLGVIRIRSKPIMTRVTTPIDGRGDQGVGIHGLIRERQKEPSWRRLSNNSDHGGAGNHATPRRRRALREFLIALFRPLGLREAEGFYRRAQIGCPAEAWKVPSLSTVKTVEVKLNFGSVYSRRGRRLRKAETRVLCNAIRICGSR